MRFDQVHDEAIAHAVRLAGSEFTTRDVAFDAGVRAAHGQLSEQADYPPHVERHLHQHAAALGLHPAGRTATDGTRWQRVIVSAHRSAPPPAWPSAPHGHRPPSTGPWQAATAPPATAPGSKQHATLAVLIIVSVASFGLMAWLPPLWAALKNEDTPVLRRRLFAIAAGCAAAAVVAFTFFGIAPTDAAGTATGPLPWLGLLLLLAAMAAGVTVAVWQRNAGRAAAQRRQFAQLPAVQQALANRQTRQHYRELIAQDPSLAREMRVGRPDLPRGYTDGGLLDLNAMPAEALATMANLDPEQAQQVIVTRERLGRLSSVDDLVVHAGMEPHTAEGLRERAVFL